MTGDSVKTGPIDRCPAPVEHVLTRYGVDVADLAPLIGGPPLRGSECASNGVVRSADVESCPAEQRFRLLAEASVQLRDAHDISAGLAGVARLIVPTVADWAAIDFADQQGHIRRPAMAVGDAISPGLRLALEKQHFTRLAEGAAAAAIIGDRSRYMKRLTGLGLASIIAAPLRSHRRHLGTLLLGAAQPGRQFIGLDLAFADSVATLCALTIENARLCRAAKQAIAAREEFLGSVSHELRTPLSHVKGFVSTLRRRDVVFEAETREDFLAEVEREADRLAKLIETLVDGC